MIPEDLARAIAAMDTAAHCFADVRVPDQCPDEGYVHSEDAPIPERLTARHVRALRAARDELHRVVGREYLAQILTQRR